MNELAIFESQSTGKTLRYLELTLKFATRQFLEKSSSSSDGSNLSNEKNASDSLVMLLLNPRPLKSPSSLRTMSMKKVIFESNGNVSKSKNEEIIMVE